jgi:hypothetical protein
MSSNPASDNLVAEDDGGNRFGEALGNVPGERLGQHPHEFLTGHLLR